MPRVNFEENMQKHAIKFLNSRNHAKKHAIEFRIKFLKLKIPHFT